MYYPQEVLDEVLAKTDIVDVVSAHVHLKKQGKDYVGLCPFHNEKTPSFNVIPSKNIFYCFGCGAGGSAITFLMKYNNSSFQEALQELADRAQVTLPAPNMSEETKKREKHRQDLMAMNREAAVYYYRLLRSRRGGRGMRYFTDRGLTPETMQKFGLGFADGSRSDLTAWLREKGFSDELILESDLAVYNEKQGIHDRFWNRVMFPIQDARGRVIGFGGRVLGDGKPKYINSSDTQIFDKGRNLYALHLARRSKADHLILCEGYMDVIAMHQAGFTQAVASLGTAFTPGQAALLKRYTGRILLAYDSDGAGVRAALRNIGILRSGGLESAVIDLRPHKDPDEFIRAEGKEAFQERIDSAENSFFYELRMLSRSYRMEDPSGRTAFHREIARKLCGFTDEIERDNYIAAAAEKYFIKTDSLRRLVAQYGRVSGDGGSSPAQTGNAAGVRGMPPAPVRPPLPQGSSPGPEADSRPVPQGTAGGEGGPAGRRGVSTNAPSRAEKALLRRQDLLLTWAAEEPRVFFQIRKYLQPEDFFGKIYQQTARLLWDSAEREGEAAAASVISAFETQEEQEYVSSILNTPLYMPRHASEDSSAAPFGEGRGQQQEREKTLRELVYSIKEAAVDRGVKQPADPAGGSASLAELLAAKQQLQTIRTARFQVGE
ncbi:MAG: DNA primase [Eubacteriales bacterium]|nr:DNA primase [Eubacteriales bacterium]